MPDTRERVYLIQCPGMDRADRVIVKDLGELMRMIENYIRRFGDLDLLYRER